MYEEAMLYAIDALRQELQALTVATGQKFHSTSHEVFKEREREKKRDLEAYQRTLQQFREGKGRTTGPKIWRKTPQDPTN